VIPLFFAIPRRSSLVSHARSPRLVHLGVTQPVPDQPEVGAPITARMPPASGGWRCTPRDLQRAKVAGIKRASEAAKLLSDLADRGRGQLERGKSKKVTAFVLAS
jgi:hypothetical protein